MVKNGSDINLDDKYGQTCIYYAIKEGHYEVVEYLIKNGADLNKFDKKKLTPYTFALKHNKIKIADLLISNGASVNNGKTTSKKTKSKKQDEEEKFSQIDENKPKKYVLVRILDNGEKVALNNNELSEFFKQNPEISKLCYNEDSNEENDYSQE